MPHVVGQQQRTAVDRRPAEHLAVARLVTQAHVQVQRDLIAGLPHTTDLEVRAGRRSHGLRSRRLHLGVGRPGRNSQLDGKLGRLFRSDAYPHVSLQRVLGLLPDGHPRAVGQLQTGLHGTEIIDRQSLATAHQGPLGEHPQAAGGIDRAAVQLRGSGAGLKDDGVVRGFPDAVHGRVVGPPVARRMLCAEHAVEGGVLQLVGRRRVAAEAQRVDSDGHPGDGAAGFDGALLIRAAGGLLAGGESARVVTVPSANALPMVQKGRSILRVAGDQVQLDQALQVVKAFPSRLGCSVELDARGAGAEIIAGLLPVLFDLLHHAEISFLARDAMESAQGVDDGQVHFGGPRVDHSPLGVEIGLAGQVGGLAAGCQCRLLPGPLVPHQQGQHAVVMSPQVPILQ